MVKGQLFQFAAAELFRPREGGHEAPDQRWRWRCCSQPS